MHTQLYVYGILDTHQRHPPHEDQRPPQEFVFEKGFHEGVPDVIRAEDIDLHDHPHQEGACVDDVGAEVSVPLHRRVVLLDVPARPNEEDEKDE